MTQPSLSVVGLHAFAATQTGPYDYINVEECPIAQYLRSQLPADTTVTVGGWGYHIDGHFTNDTTMFDILNDQIRVNDDDGLAIGRTWEELTERLAVLV